MSRVCRGCDQLLIVKSRREFQLYLLGGNRYFPFPGIIRAALGTLPVCQDFNVDLFEGKMLGRPTETRNGVACCILIFCNFLYLPQKAQCLTGPRATDFMIVSTALVLTAR